MYINSTRVFSCRLRVVKGARFPNGRPPPPALLCAAIDQWMFSANRAHAKSEGWVMTSMCTVNSMAYQRGGMEKAAFAARDNRSPVMDADPQRVLTISLGRDSDSLEGSPRPIWKGGSREGLFCPRGHPRARGGGSTSCRRVSSPLS